MLFAATKSIISLFEETYDILFWLKDAELKILALNQTFAECVNLPRERILGKTDADLYFPEFARVFMEDDRHVIQTGEPIRRKVELLANRFGEVEWRATTKLPVKDGEGRTIATVGISRPIAESSENIPKQYQAISQITRYCRQHMADGVDVAKMAEIVGMSISTLSRYFRKYLRISPGEFLSHLRLSRACKLLSDTPLNVNEITFECGYESPAAFSRAFRRQMKLTPKAYRKSFNEKT